MIQFTIGCILLALTLFFGGKDILGNNDIIANLEKTLQKDQSKLERSKAIKNRYNNVSKNAIENNVNIKNNLVNQLNINPDKYNFDITLKDDKNRILTANTFKISGYEKFGRIFSLLSDIEKTTGLEIDSTCFNCKLDNKKLNKLTNEVAFKIEGKVYVYNKQ